MPSFAIAQIDDSHRDLAITTTSRAFWPDPLFGHFARSDLQEHRVLPIFLGALVRDALAHGEVHGAFVDGRLIGSASWLPPGTMPRSRGRELRIQLACARALVTCRNRRTGIRLLDEIENIHPTEPHWYLALLGVDPAHKGHGHGRALLDRILERCDHDLEPAYLETQKPENLPFYERFGFVVRDEILFDDAPPMWTMWRDPDPRELRRSDRP